MGERTELDSETEDMEGVHSGLVVRIGVGFGPWRFPNWHFADD